MWSLLLAEYKKQSRSKLAYVGLVGAGVMAAMWPSAMNHYLDTMFPLTGYETICATMQAVLSMLVFIFAAIFAAGLVSAETSRRTLVYILERPVGRLSFLAAKFVAAFVYTILMTLTALGVVTVVVAVTIGFNAPSDAMIGVRVPAGLYWRQMSLALVMALSPLFATVAFGMFFSVLFRNVGTAIGAAAGLLLVQEPLKYLIRWGDHNIEPWLWTKYFGHALQLVKHTAEGVPDLWNTPQTWSAVLIPAVWFVVFTTGSVWLMLRRDWG